MHLYPERLQGAGNNARSPHLFEPQFGVRVQIAAQGREFVMEKPYRFKRGACVHRTLQEPG
ncbi:hypothetical protein D554_1609 [Bordetella holmesii 30539]|uniref:N-acetyltransferase YedL n=1 Tax=Bordetella holmesii 1058 TaxID=1247648 RepID=A0ABN0RUM3_9BORD|nr:hypothetical protein D560_2159 [Bordetella holmesii ATCC 51541]EWM47386.1 hypothetical protein D555_2177 [Bordetella holmesii 35009]EXF88790.1 hypothetical protein D554_1609 [Bordetella holmesii 30539]EXX92873.1 hypothetical protein D559_0259 [Bordetella holmesii 1058]